ncbi:MAG: hypothetical protein NTV68_00240, partial [Methanomicrobiales archaeon]|nr:hypothetical protein [Methanomicrobiales archaeon]
MSPGNLPVHPPAGCCNNPAENSSRVLEEWIGSRVVIPLCPDPAIVNPDDPVNDQLFQVTGNRSHHRYEKSNG